jgi:hypothetical protein
MDGSCNERGGNKKFVNVARKSEGDFNYVSSLLLHSAATFSCVICGNWLNLELAAFHCMNPCPAPVLRAVNYRT